MRRTLVPDRKGATMFTADSHSSGVEPMRGYVGGSCLRAGVRRLAAASVVGVALMAGIAAPGALAAGQQHDRFHDTDAFADDNFCDTGQTIEITIDVRGNIWEAPHKGDFRSTGVGTATFTNPVTGDVVINRFANVATDVFVSGDPEGIHVVESTVRGLPEQLKTPHGGVLLRDAGYVVIRNTFDGEEAINQEILVIKGPHPDLESGFELFCETVVPALGIED
jgi:hypothetical protein